jgi:hypothetical protein
MTAPLARLAAAPQAPHVERRRFPRRPAWAAALLRSSHGDESPVVLADVTSHGCCVQCEADWLRVGSFVSLELEQDPALQAIIRWVRDGTAGMEFLREVSSEHAEWHALMDSPY